MELHIDLSCTSKFTVRNLGYTQCILKRKTYNSKLNVYYIDTRALIMVTKGVIQTVRLILVHHTLQNKATVTYITEESHWSNRRGRSACSVCINQEFAPFRTRGNKLKSSEAKFRREMPGF